MSNKCKPYHSADVVAEIDYTYDKNTYPYIDRNKA